MKDHTFDMFLNTDKDHAYTHFDILSAGDKRPNGVSPTIITFMRDDGVEIYHSLSTRIGIGQAIRHARGIGTHHCVLWWKVVLGNGITIAESRYGD